MMLMRTMKLLISGDNVPGDVFYLLHLHILMFWGFTLFLLQGGLSLIGIRAVLL